MTLFNNNANLKQFQLIKFVNENSDDDNVMTKISITFRRDKIEAPYYINVKIRITSCIDAEDKGIIHAMDVLNHHRMYNLKKDTYNEVKIIADNLFEDDFESDLVKITSNENENKKIVLMSRNNKETENLFEDYHELFDVLDNLIE